MRRLNLELIVWPAALVFLALLDPAHPPAFSLCPLHHLGLPCPGCGLGRAMAWALHGQMAASWAAHPLGIPALGIIIHRIFILARGRLKPGEIPKFQK
ncbi:MAG: DUF2752 domain-containing protein [Candidatus Zixiibacteriota bacterium]|nr:MAG: DUF2752 domain-containing protein [candidate division Zixibacteria bacterium]